MDAKALRRFLSMASPQPFGYSLNPRRVAYLAEIIGKPTHYTQRFVEQLSFIATGGQRWQRTLQIEIPTAPGRAVKDWWIVPLGSFKRRRLADVVVKDADDRRLNLLTRQQHGDVLVNVITTNYLLAPRSGGIVVSNVREQLESFRARLFDFFTAFGALGSLAERVEQEYAEILKPLDPCIRTQLEDKFREDLSEWVEGTQYLCWVHATPGEVVNLQVSYTASDPNHELQVGGIKEARNSLKTGLPWKRSGKARKQRAKWYRQYGLTPIDYSFETFSTVGSYYFTLERPPYTSLTYLDWNSGHHFHETHSAEEMQEVNCAFPAAHKHATTESKGAEKAAAEDEMTSDASASGGKRDERIRAYLRCAPYRHKQILGAAALNLALVWLLARGELPFGVSEPVQGLILTAPTVIIGLLAQQKRHYYAQVMRRQRWLLWMYLAVSVCFLVAVAFSERDRSEGLGVGATVAAWALAILSAGMFGWHLPLGDSYQRLVRQMALKQNRRDPTRPMWQCYGDAVQKYAFRVVTLTFGLMVLSGIGMSLWWDGSQARPTSEAGRSKVSIQVNGIEMPGAPSPARSRHLAPNTNPPRATRPHQSGG